MSKCNLDGPGQLDLDGLKSKVEDANEVPGNAVLNAGTVVDGVSVHGHRLKKVSDIVLRINN